MRLIHIPLPQLRSLARACPGLLDAIATAAQEGVDPSIRVLRVATDRERVRWYLSVGSSVLVLDSTDLAAMAAVVPIFLVDLVQEVREELAPLFDDGVLDSEVAKLIPFGPCFGGRGRPS